MMKPTNSVYNGPVHTRDHGPGCSVAVTKPNGGKAGAKGFIVCPWKRYNNRGGSTPRGTPGGPQVEPKF